MKLVSRSAWGARSSKYTLAYIGSTRGVKVHYEGTYVPKSLANADQHSKCDDRMRDIQASHLNHPTEDYSDIAYNFVVCPHGYVYEGRGLHKKTGANGNQYLNGQDYAVCAMLGASGLVIPPDAMLNGIVDAIHLLQNKGGAGNWVGGHRDGHPTKCPGDPLYNWVKTGAKAPGGTGTQTGGQTPIPADETGTIARYKVRINGLEYGYGAKGDHVTKVGQALVKAGFGKHYKVGPGPTWSDADTLNYSDYQKSLGYKGAAPHQDADGVPGEVTLKRLLGTLPAKAATSPKFPGREYFRPGEKNKYVTLLGQQLVKKGYGSYYKVGPGPSWGEADRKATAAFQRNHRDLAGDADGYPGPLTWKILFS